MGGGGGRWWVFHGRLSFWHGWSKSNKMIKNTNHKGELWQHLAVEILVFSVDGEVVVAGARHHLSLPTRHPINQQKNRREDLIRLPSADLSVQPARRTLQID